VIKSNKTTFKVLYSFFTLFLAVTSIFFVLRLTPGDPVEKILGQDAKPQEIVKYREQLGLHLPMWKQYLQYLKGIVSLDLGKSLFSKKDVKTLLLQHLPPSLILAVVALSFSSILGFILGVYSAVKKGMAFDQISRIGALLCLSFPIFSIAPLLVLLFSIKMGVLPVSEWGEFRHIVLPALTLVLPLGAILMRVTRNKFLEEKNEQWVMVCEAKGLSSLATNIRIAKVCLPTVLTVVGIQLSVVLAGTIVTESIFDIPGLGLLLFDSIQNRDYPVVQAVIAYSTIIYLAVYFMIDFANEKLDPRIGGG
jgi:peptide/nickel transport system permease protein